MRKIIEITGCTLAEASRMASLSPARFLKRDATIGSIEAGKRADLIVVAAGAIHQQPQRPAENPYSLLVYSTRASDVETVIVDGRVVVRDRRVLTLDEAEVVARAAELRARIAAGP